MRLLSRRKNTAPSALRVDDGNSIPQGETTDTPSSALRVDDGNSIPQGETTDTPSSTLGVDDGNSILLEVTTEAPSSQPQESTEDILPETDVRRRPWRRGFRRLFGRRKVNTLSLETGEASSSQAQEPTEDTPPDTDARRRPRKRGIRRLFGRQRVTLSLEDGVIRVVILRGREVVAWGTATPAQESVAQAGEASPQGEEQAGEASPQSDVQADRLRTLLKELGVRRGRAVTDLPLQVPLMRHLQLPKMRRRYLEEVITSEVLATVPFALEEMDLAWQVRRSSTGQEVLAVATFKEAVDGHVRLLREAGIRPRAAYSKAVALAHAAGIPDGVVVHLGLSRAEFVLVRQWVPRVVYQIDLAGGVTSLQEQAEAVARAVDEVAGYYQTVGLGDGSQQLPVVLMGLLSSDDSLAEALQQALQREVVPFAPPLVYPDHFAASEYAANLGLALADRARTKARGKASRQGVPSINLLSERHLPRPLPVQPIAVFVTLLLLGAAAFNITPQVDSVSNQVAVLSARVTNLHSQERQQRLALGRADAIEKDIQAVDQFRQVLESHLVDLESEMGVLLAQMETLTRSALPPNVVIANLSQQGGGFTLSGTAPTYEDALQYAENLRASGLFSSVRTLRAEELGGTTAPEAAQEAGVENVTFHLEAFAASVPGRESDAQSQ